MLDVECAFAAAHLFAYLGDMFQIAGQQGQEVGAHLRRHVRQQGGQPRLQRGDIPRAERGEVERATVDAMDDQGILVGFEAADQRVDGAVAAAENMFDLAADFLRVLDCRLRVVGKAGTTAGRIALRPVVGNQEQHAPALTDHALDVVREHLAEVTLEAVVAHGALALLVEPAQVLEVVRSLKDSFEFDMFLDVTAVDWIGQAPRFEVVWHFYSTRDHVRVRLKTRVPESDPTVDSLTALYGSAGYMERECHDMYGIAFRGNADLRPILLYEGFKGHPLRKDYPKQHEQPLVPYRS